VNAAVLSGNMTLDMKAIAVVLVAIAMLMAAVDARSMKVSSATTSCTIQHAA
jgi:hypothetical protein